MKHSFCISKSILLILGTYFLSGSQVSAKIYPKYLDIGIAFSGPQTPFSSVFKLSPKTDGEYWREIGAKAYFDYTKRLSFALAFGYIKNEFLIKYDDSYSIAGYSYSRKQYYYVSPSFLLTWKYFRTELGVMLNNQNHYGKWDYTIGNYYHYEGSGRHTRFRRPLIIAYEIGPPSLHLVLNSQTTMPIHGGGSPYEIGIQTRNSQEYAHKLYYSYSYENAGYSGQIAYKGEFGISRRYAAILGIGSSQHKWEKVLAMAIGLRINFDNTGGSHPPLPH